MKNKPDMQYRLKEDCRFVCGVTSFGMPAGAVVRVNQVDAGTHKVLIDFGGGLTDWFDESILAKRFEAVHKEVEMPGDREAWLASLSPEDRMFEEIKSMASETYRRHRASVKGQQVSAADDMDQHLIWAAKRWIEKNEPAPVTARTERQPAPDVSGLTEALRQYRHNDDGGLVFGYDKLLVDRYVAGLVEALDGAARSLGTISRQAGIDEYMCDFLEVRGYARNRSMVALEALAAHRNQGGEP